MCYLLILNVMKFYQLEVLAVKLEASQPPNTAFQTDSPAGEILASGSNDNVIPLYYAFSAVNSLSSKAEAKWP
jgi:hypothetical protein